MLETPPRRKSHSLRAGKLSPKWRHPEELGPFNDFWGGKQALRGGGIAGGPGLYFTVEGHSPYSGLAFKSVASEIRNPDGSIVFSQSDIEVPLDWSQVASDVLAQKYFRKAGVPKALKPVPEEGMPEFLWRKQPRMAARDPKGHGRREIRQGRCSTGWPAPGTYWGWKGGYFDREGRCPDLL